ncbi:putative viral replication protein [Onchocerca flexuosa]|uniref:Putative viral replication protein n=1 Tax=Onchocerca flexuosa TaxID=387005 RepID=A0A238BMX9_9BILA|nr:putative viral replication protein [Onchocerca flexuosa]
MHSMYRGMIRSRCFVGLLGGIGDVGVEITIGNGLIYATIGRETCPTTGRTHLQGFLKFNSPVRFSMLQAKLPRGTHIESAKGTDFQNYKYCSKETIQEEIGTRLLEAKKRKSDIQDEWGVEVFARSHPYTH